MPHNPNFWVFFPAFCAETDKISGWEKQKPPGGGPSGRYGVLGVGLPQQEQTREACVYNHADGVYLHDLGAEESGDENGQANPEVPRVGGRCGEVLRIHQQQGRSCQQTHHRGAHHAEHALHHGGVHVLEEEAAYQYHQDERGEHQGKGGGGAAQDGHRAAQSGVLHGRVATVGGAVDADGARRHLADGHDVGELGARHPLVVHHHLGLDEREHAVAAAETEEAYLEEGEKQTEKNHDSVDLRYWP